MSRQHMKDSLKQQVALNVDRTKPLLVEISRYIYQHPELGHSEFAACSFLVATLQQHGFQVQQGIAGMATAFRASTAETGRGREPRPKVAFLAEYDALPELGHACGHNLIAAMTVGAAIALAGLSTQIPGTVVVLGTPAEEGAVDRAGGKAVMAQHGVFDDIDAAMMFHPSSRTMVEATSTAREALEISFYGRGDHSLEPDGGVNALDALIQTFNGWNALRQHLPVDARVHGIITRGGTAPSIVPDFVQARAYVRASDRNSLAALVKKVTDCARGAAETIGARVEITNTAETYDHMISNVTLARACQENLETLGIAVEKPGKKGAGSTDMGNVSHLVPSIHPYIAICEPGIVAHTAEFARATMSKRGKAAMIAGAKALAMTAIDLFLDPHLLNEVKREFRRVIQQSESAD